MKCQNLKKKNVSFPAGLGGGQGRCEQRSEVFVKIQKKKWGGGWGTGIRGVRMELNEELKFL